MNGGDLSIGFWGLSRLIHRFWGCIRGLYPLGWGDGLGRRGRALLGDGSAGGEGVYAGELLGIALLSAVHSGSTVDEFFDRRPDRNFTIVQSTQGMR